MIKKRVALLMMFGSIALTAFLLSGCATPHPEVVPELQMDRLPSLSLKSLSPRILELTIKNTRDINLQHNNVRDIEERVRTAILNVFDKSQIREGKSKNKLQIDVLDCKQQAEGSECVRVEATLDVGGKYKLEMSASSSNGYGRDGQSWQKFGSVSEAYQNALTLLLNSLNEKFPQ